MVRNRKLVGRVLMALGALLLIGFFIYSLIEYRRSGIARDGVVTCANGQCFWSAHVHVDIAIRICGREYPLTKFKGPLSNVHTHGEEQVIHWHSKLRYDPERRRFLEPSPFIIRTTLEQQGIELGADTFFGKRDGDSCNGEKGFWKVFVNGKHQSDWLHYEWRDRDVIRFIFDERTVEGVERELRQHPLKFPPFGEG